MRRPGDGFYRRKMLSVLLDRAQAGVIPDEELAERKDVIKLTLQSCVCNTHKPRRRAGTDEGGWPTSRFPTALPGHMCLCSALAAPRPVPPCTTLNRRATAPPGSQQSLT